MRIAKTRAKLPKAEERKMDWESVSHGSHDDSHGSHGSHVDSHDSLARWLAVCQDPQEVGALVTTRCTVSTVRDH